MGRFFTLVVILFTTLVCSSTVFATQVFPFESTPSNQEPIPATGSSAFTGCGGIPIDPINEEYEQEIVEETNQIRMAAGLTPLKKVDELNLSAAITLPI